MEADAKHDFNATADDELSFHKGDVIKVSTPFFTQKLAFKCQINRFCLHFRTVFNSTSGFGHGRGQKLVQSRTKWKRRFHSSKLYKTSS